MSAMPDLYKEIRQTGVDGFIGFPVDSFSKSKDTFSEGRAKV